jgi:alkanesulfonate monooxygenase SsuD/methylene tetrahydromethanopterin reductase-like flavin-dependent oxidoreductase (luciferase family)
MDGRPQTGALLRLAERARAVGFDSIWVGDSLLAPV